MTFRKPIAVTTSALLLAILAASVAEAAKRPPLNADEIKAALRTAEIEDKGFVDAVVQLVNEGRLSRSMVISSFQWARKKIRLRFQYFKYSLLTRMSPRERRLLAERIARNRRQAAPVPI